MVRVEHHIVEASTSFFASRFADMPWSILTPDVCAHWDGHAVLDHISISKAEAPTEDRWRKFGGVITPAFFNPARLKVPTEMLKRGNPPEASLIKPLIGGVENSPARRWRGAATEPAMSRKTGTTTISLRYAKRPPIAAPARSGRTRPRPYSAKARQNAQVMLVGEQPGDKEDLAGQPFVGPAGQMLGSRAGGSRHRPVGRSTSPMR